MKKCNRCGKELNDSSNFCTACGSPDLFVIEINNESAINAQNRQFDPNSGDDGASNIVQNLNTPSVITYTPPVNGQVAEKDGANYETLNNGIKLDNGNIIADSETDKNKRRNLKMLETKSMTVAPDQEQNTINLMFKFGWTVQSSQEINVKDSHLEQRNGDLYSVTESQHYVKLVFQRDTSMPNYNEIAYYENQYNSIPVPSMYRSSKLFTIIGAAIALLALLFFASGDLIGIILGIIFVALASLSIAHDVKKNSKKEDAYDAEMQKYNAQVADIFNKVSAYIK